MWIAAIFVNVGMWLERFNIIVISLHRDFIPGSWSMYAPTAIDLALFTGTICFFGMNFLLFLRFVPSVAASEIKEMAHEMRHKANG
jgi:molybdopterin-containing oxidoreductase family membrane subunit